MLQDWQMSMARDHCDEVLQVALKAQWLRSCARPSGRERPVCRALCWLGRRLVNAGLWLDRRYGPVPLAA